VICLTFSYWLRPLLQERSFFADTLDADMDSDKIDFSFFTWATILGALIGLGQILDSTENLSWRIVVGRALVSAGLAASAPALLTLFPHMPRMAEFAFAAALASLGTSALQSIVRRLLTGQSK
jgi:hypothetical protein